MGWQWRLKNIFFEMVNNYRSTGHSFPKECIVRGEIINCMDKVRRPRGKEITWFYK